MSSTDDPGIDERGILTQQLVALKQSLEALGAQVDAMLLVVAGPQEAPELCEHPLDQRKSLGQSMGDRRFMCMACRETVTPEQGA